MLVGQCRAVRWRCSACRVLLLRAPNAENACETLLARCPHCGCIKDYLPWARKIADNIIGTLSILLSSAYLLPANSRGKAVGSDGMQWVVEEQRVNPDRTRGAFAGYFEGAAGIGSMFLAVDEAVRGVPLAVRGAVLETKLIVVTGEHSHPAAGKPMELRVWLLRRLLHGERAVSSLSSSCALRCLTWNLASQPCMRTSSEWTFVAVFTRFAADFFAFSFASNFA